MPIKAKRIDPSRARLAARGQWQKPPPTASGASGKDSIDKPSRSSSNSSSTSSEDSTVRRGARRSTRLSEKPKKPVPPAFLTTTGGSGDDDSDPELYRAARERTARFLYPNGRQPAMASSRNGHHEAPLDKTTSEATSVRTVAPSKSPKKEKERESSTTRIPISSAEKDAVPIETSDSVSALSREARHEVHADLSRGPSDEGPTHWVCPQPPAAVRDALAPAVDAADFRRLLELLADDVGKAREPTSSLGDPLRGEKEEGTIDKKEKSSEAVGLTRIYARPARSFAELEEQALLQLYDAASESQTYFIATEHTSEAFTIAALSAEKRNRHVDPATEPPIPVSIVELDAAERTRRNAYAALQERQRRHSESALVDNSSITNDALLSINASVLAANAEQSLQRFLSCVHWIEVAMRNRRFIDEVGRFLYAHHRPFLQPTAGTNNGAREFGHEAFTAYEQFSRSVSEYITTVLRYRVPGYSAEEFVLSLYDPPPMNSGGDNDNKEENDAGGSPHPSGTMDVLSFHAWRLLQAVLSFEQFCAFMDEFITEEYGVDEGDDGAVESGGRGALSIRALLAKSRQRRTQQQQQQQQQQVQQKEHQWESSSPVQLEGLPNPAPRPCSTTSLSDNTCASRESLVSASTLPSRLPISHTPPPLPASHRSSRNSVASFPRRPDALPGRTLPPLEETSTVQPPRPTMTNAKEQGRGRSRSTKRTGVGSTSNGTGLKPKAPGNAKAKPV